MERSISSGVVGQPREAKWMVLLILLSLLLRFFVFLFHSILCFFSNSFSVCSSFTPFVVSSSVRSLSLSFRSLLLLQFFFFHSILCFFYNFLSFSSSFILFFVSSSILSFSFPFLSFHSLFLLQLSFFLFYSIFCFYFSHFFATVGQFSLSRWQLLISFYLGRKKVGGKSNKGAIVTAFAIATATATATATAIAKLRDKNAFSRSIVLLTFAFFSRKKSQLQMRIEKLI